jgi:DNA-binding CsgD family transcriptional regulator
MQDDKVSKNAVLALLTRQHINILELSAQGLRASAVGARLGITEKTVKFHKTAMYKILGVTSIVQALLRYESITADDNYATHEVGEYRTPAYSKLLNKVTELQQRCNELQVTNAQLREDYKALILSNALKGATHKINKRPTKAKPTLPELVAGQGTGMCAGVTK